MTPGPARRIVTLLPKKRPTPIAPPMASMLSCRWVSLRLSSAVSPGWLGKSFVPGARPSEVSGTLFMPAQIEQDVGKATYFFPGVVVDCGDSNDPAILAQTEAIHQPRRVHVTIAYANACIRHSLGNFCRRGFLKVETQGGNAFVHPVIFAHAVNRGAAFTQNTQEF